MSRTIRNVAPSVRDALQTARTLRHVPMMAREFDYDNDDDDVTLASRHAWRAHGVRFMRNESGAIAPHDALLIGLCAATLAVGLLWLFCSALDGVRARRAWNVWQRDERRSAAYYARLARRGAERSRT